MAGADRAGRGAVAPGGGRSGNVASAENDPVPLVESRGAGVDRDQPLIPHARTRRRQIRPNASGNRWPCAADVSEYSGTFPATGEGIVAVRHYARAVAVAVAVARRAGSSWSGGEDGELAHSYGLMIIEGLPTGGAATWRKTPMVAGPLSRSARSCRGHKGRTGCGPNPAAERDQATRRLPRRGRCRSRSRAGRRPADWTMHAGHFAGPENGHHPVAAASGTAPGSAAVGDQLRASAASGAAHRPGEVGGVADRDPRLLRNARVPARRDTRAAVG